MSRPWWSRPGASFGVDDGVEVIVVAVEDLRGRRVLVSAADCWPIGDSGRVGLLVGPRAEIVALVPAEIVDNVPVLGATYAEPQQWARLIRYRRRRQPSTINHNPSGRNR